MPISHTETYTQLVERLASNYFSELVFVNGKSYSGDISCGCIKGLGWKEGRTVSIHVNPSIPSDAEVFIIDLKYLRLRKCKLIKEAKTPTKGEFTWQVWEAIDLIEDIEEYNYAD
jgi:hypothetical protein